MSRMAEASLTIHPDSKPTPQPIRGGQERFSRIYDVVESVRTISSDLFEPDILRIAEPPEVSIPIFKADIMVRIWMMAVSKTI
ncbi:hypothetical protein VTO42DRAFT_1428 [Malbranchea cinnamomea]